MNQDQFDASLLTHCGLTPETAAIVMDEIRRLRESESLAQKLFNQRDKELQEVLKEAVEVERERNQLKRENASLREFEAYVQKFGNYREAFDRSKAK
jgi:16S rRNA A1518/A1519 N6-dimethyltransferase RsmA/KsgA/DIM1 with predicted DNA glycosylase/AP lyase activity